MFIKETEIPLRNKENSCLALNWLIELLVSETL